MPDSLCAPAAAKNEVDWGEYRAGVQPRQRLPQAPSSLGQSLPSLPRSTAAAAPDRTAPSPCSCSLINLQVNEQIISRTIHPRKGGTRRRLPKEPPAAALPSSDIERRLGNLAKAPRCGARTRAG